MNATETILTGSEKMALVRKYRTNAFRGISEFTQRGLVGKGLIEAGCKRLTEAGRIAAESAISENNSRTVAF